MGHWEREMCCNSLCFKHCNGCKVGKQDQAKEQKAKCMPKCGRGHNLAQSLMCMVSIENSWALL